MPLQRLQDEHREILQLAGQLLAIARLEQAADPSALAQNRWRLASMIGRHLANEDSMLQSLPRDAGESETTALLDRYNHEAMELRSGFAAHNMRWPLAEVLADWHGYYLDLESQIARLERHILWEEQHLFPRLRFFAPVGHVMTARQETGSWAAGAA